MGRKKLQKAQNKVQVTFTIKVKVRAAVQLKQKVIATNPGLLLLKNVDEIRLLLSVSTVYYQWNEEGGCSNKAAAGPK